MGIPKNTPLQCGWRATTVLASSGAFSRNVRKAASWDFAAPVDDQHWLSVVIARSRNPFMKNLLIHWYKDEAPTSPSFPSLEALLERLKPVAELTERALTRLVLRLRAHYPVCLPVRLDADPATLVSWLTQAGVEVGVVAKPGPAPLHPEPRDS